MFGRRLVPGLVASVAAVSVLAGCGGGGGPGELAGLTPVAAVTKAAEKAASESATYTFEVDGTGLDIRGSGAFRGGDDPAVQMVFDAIEVADFAISDGLEFRLVDQVAYVKVPGGVLPGVDQGWLKLPVEDLESSGNSFGGDLGLDAAVADPREQLQEMLAGEQITEVGTETIDGVETTHYRAQIAPESTGTITEHRSASPDDLGPELEALLEDELGGAFGVGDPAQVDVWIDGDYHPRRMELAMPVPMLGELTMIVEMREFGSEVTVEAPADAETLDPEAMFSEFGDEVFGDIFGEGGAGADFFSEDFFSGEGLDGMPFDSEEFEAELREQIERSVSANLGARGAA